MVRRTGRLAARWVDPPLRDATRSVPSADPMVVLPRAAGRMVVLPRSAGRMVVLPRSAGRVGDLWVARPAVLKAVRRS